MLVPNARGANFLPPGTRLGKYELVRGIAAGGMAELYLARSVALEAFDRLVALKRILPQYALDEEFVRMFLDEARLTAKLQHPNIAQVYDIGVDTEGIFFTMELVRGEDVQSILRTEHVRGQRVPLPHALAIVIGACRGLHAAHEQKGPDGEPLGIVHRDISPSNVIVSFDGCIKLIDFGVAKWRSQQVKTRNGTIKGKVSYMSPEQCRAEPLDRRSDVFALGILLYELTTTQRLFTGENEFAIIKRIIYRDAPLPSRSVADYPPDLETIVMRALSRNVGRRYQSALELEQALVAFASERSLDVSTASLSSYVCGMFPDSLHAWDLMSRALSPRKALGKRGHKAYGPSSRTGDDVMAEVPSAAPAQAELAADPGPWTRPFMPEPLTPEALLERALAPEPLTPEPLPPERRTPEALLLETLSSGPALARAGDLASQTEDVPCPEPMQADLRSSTPPARVRGRSGYVSAGMVILVALCALGWAAFPGKGAPPAASVARPMAAPAAEQSSTSTSSATQPGDETPDARSLRPEALNEPAPGQAAPSHEEDEGGTMVSQEKPRQARSKSRSRKEQRRSKAHRAIQLVDVEDKSQERKQGHAWDPDAPLPP